MRKSWLVMLSTLAILGPMSLCAAPKVLWPVVVDGRWGFVSISGELVINPRFERAEVFAEGLAAIRLDKWGHVDVSGKFVINPQFDEAASFANGLARVKMGGRTGYINTTGNFIWNPAK